MLIYFLLGANLKENILYSYIFIAFSHLSFSI